MGARHPLPYAYAKAHTLLLEDDGDRLVLWAPETTPLPALSEVLRLYAIDTFEQQGVRLRIGVGQGMACAHGRLRGVSWPGVAAGAAEAAAGWQDCAPCPASWAGQQAAG